MPERGSKEWHDERAGNILSGIDGLDEKLKEVKNPPPPQVEEFTKDETTTSWIKASKKIIVNEFIDFFLEERGDKGNLLKSESTGSISIRATGHDNRWINIYINPDSGIFYARLGFLIEKGGQKLISFNVPNELVPRDGLKYIKFWAPDASVVQFGITTKGDGSEMKVIRIETNSKLYVLFETGFMGFKKSSK